MTNIPHLAQVQRLSAYAFVVDGGELLLTRISGRGHATGTWTLPGGGIDHGESPRDALVREVYEETALAAIPGELLDVHDMHFTGKAPGGVLEDYHGVHLVFAATVSGRGAERVTEEDGTTDAVAWVPLPEIGTQALPVVDVVRFACRRALGLSLES